MSEMKPCPFCGSENTVRLPYNDHADIERCKNCNLTIIVPFGYTMWNTRPIEDALHSRIAELEAERRWIPVTEKLPETDGQYIGYTNIGLVSTHWFVDGRFMVTYSCKQHWLTTPTSWTLESISSGDIYVTHWMPLPEPPIVYGKECEE